MTRCRKGSKRRARRRLLVAKAHRKVRNQRRDFHFKEARKLSDRYALIAVEDLDVRRMKRNPRYAKSISDAGWAEFISILRSKAEEAGCKVIGVDPAGTSQICVCGKSVPKALNDRWHYCNACGLSLPRDQVSAMVILARAGPSANPENPKGFYALGASRVAPDGTITERKESPGFPLAQGGNRGSTCRGAFRNQPAVPLTAEASFGGRYSNIPGVDEPWRDERLELLALAETMWMVEFLEPPGIRPDWRESTWIVNVPCGPSREGIAELEALQARFGRWNVTTGVAQPPEWGRIGLYAQSPNFLRQYLSS